MQNFRKFYTKIPEAQDYILGDGILQQLFYQFTQPLNSSERCRLEKVAP